MTLAWCPGCVKQRPNQPNSVAYSKHHELALLYKVQKDKTRHKTRQTEQDTARGICETATFLILGCAPKIRASTS